jgi:hypothetical protein
MRLGVATMKYVVLLFVCLVAAIPSRADSGAVTEWNVLGSISVTNGTASESIVFDVQFTLTPYGGGQDIFATMIGQPYEISSGALGDFSDIAMITSGPTYLAFFNAPGDEIDLEFASQRSPQLAGPEFAYVWGCRSQACTDNFSIDGLTEAIFYPGTSEVSITQIPVAEPGEIGMLLAGILLLAGVARARRVTA